MQTKLLRQAFSLSLSALITLATLMGIDRQAQPEVATQQWAVAAAAKA